MYHMGAHVGQGDQISLQAVLSHLIWVVETKLKSSERAVSALVPRTGSPAPKSPVLEPGLVAHSYNPSYPGYQDWGIINSRQVWTTEAKLNNFMRTCPRGRGKDSLDITQ